MKVGYLLLLAVIACSLQSVHSQFFTNIEMHYMLQTIDSYFFSVTPPPVYNVEIRKFLRLVFHDCMGGCDGSIKTTNPDNKGLELSVSLVTQAYAAARSTSNTNSISYMAFNRMGSRADFWVLCEERALAWGVQRGGGTIVYSPNLPHYSAGRVSVTSPTAGLIETSLPNAAGTWASMLNTFKTGNPNLSETDIVALLGLHGAGSA
jgi:hypothetical protein